MKGGAAVLVGGVAYDGNVWAGRFAQADDLDFPIKGHFRLETRGQDGGLTGSYQRDGTSIPFRVERNPAVNQPLTQAPPAIMSSLMERRFFTAPDTTTVRT